MADAMRLAKAKGVTDYTLHATRFQATLERAGQGGELTATNVVVGQRKKWRWRVSWRFDCPVYHLLCGGGGSEKQKKKNAKTAVSGDRTRVAGMTGGSTHHYTTTLIIIGFNILFKEGLLYSLVPEFRFNILFDFDIQISNWVFLV